MAQAFAGPLCRCYANAPGPAARLLPGVLAWRRELAAALGDRLPGALDWREDPEVAGLVAELGDAGFAALRLFACYAERSDLELPDTVPLPPGLDRAFRAAQDRQFAGSRYGQLLACRLWLPLEFVFTARAPLPDGEEAELGSLVVLRDQLRWLNQRTWQADEGEIARWSSMPAPAGGALLPAAQRGFAGLWAAVQWGIAARQPVVIRGT